jgi:hypothetical protein
MYNTHLVEKALNTDLWKLLARSLTGSSPVSMRPVEKHKIRVLKITKCGFPPCMLYIW